MTITFFLFPLLLLAFIAAANPVVVNRSPVTLPLARFINFTGVHNLLQHDQARAEVLKNRGFGRGAGGSAPAAIIDEPATDRLVSYVASVGFGSQATLYSLIIDTGRLDAQIWPRSLNTNIGGTAGSIYLTIGDLGSNTGQGLDFINGLTFLQRFYSVFDNANQRVGLATTPYTTSTANF